MTGLGIGLGMDKIPVGFDPDAISFFTRAGITNPAQMGAVNTLVGDLKASNVWNKLIGIYPIVGGTAASHSQNLRSNTCPIFWVNGPTHNAFGVTGNGTTQYGYFSDTLTNYPRYGHMSVYLNAPASTAGFYRDYIGFGNEAGDGFYFIIQGVNVNLEFISGSVATGATTGAVNPLQGIIALNRRSDTELVGYKNSTVVATNVAADLNPVPLTLEMGFMCRMESGGPFEISDGTFAFAAFGNALSHTESIAYYNAVQRFETSLGRSI